MFLAFCDRNTRRIGLVNRPYLVGSPYRMPALCQRSPVAPSRWTRLRSRKAGDIDAPDTPRRPGNFGNVPRFGLQRFRPNLVISGEVPVTLDSLGASSFWNGRLDRLRAGRDSTFAFGWWPLVTRNKSDGRCADLA